MSGQVHNVNRTVYATLRRRSFLDYLYFTEYETKDPALYVKPPDPFTPAQAQTACSKHYYEGRNSQCTTIYFTDRDTINGPLHSNDAINICGDPDFNGPVTTSYQPASGNRWLDCGGSNPTWQSAGDPKYAAPLVMPPSNTSLKSDADGTVGGTGCLYTGPTQIELFPGGTISVISPFTKVDQPGLRPGREPPAAGERRHLRAERAVEPVRPQLRHLRLLAAGLGHVPVPAGPSRSDAGRPQHVQLPAGDVFLEGTLKGGLTIGAENNISIIGNTKYAGGVTGTDVLGLVANGAVKVFHPVDCDDNTSTCDMTRKAGAHFNGSLTGGDRFDNPQIYAAILSVQHTFIVPYYWDGTPRGTLTVDGAIGQKYRGPVGTFSGSSIVTGYAKGYTYDSRLKYLSPPRFLNAVQAAWQVSTWGEIPTPNWP